MPIVLLIAVAIFGIFTCMLVAGSLENSPFILRSVILLAFAIFFIGPWVWAAIAWDQDELQSGYYFVDIQQYPSGQFVYMVYPENTTGMQVCCDVALPPETVIRVWRYNKWKNGINWMNEGVNRLEIITPSDVRYEKVKDKAKHRKLKIIEKK